MLSYLPEDPVEVLLYSSENLNGTFSFRILHGLKS
jgi:hypothetical protein